jgi:predicted transcriptional regulator
LQNSKPYVEFLKKNELLTEAAYQHALSNIEEVTKGELRKMKMEMDKVEVTLNTIEKERVLKQKKHLETMNAVLSAAVPDWISKNRIMDNVDISRYELDLFLDVAVQKKFMEFSSDTRLYRTTESGLNFIKTYKRLSR